MNSEYDTTPAKAHQSSDFVFTATTATTAAATKGTAAGHTPASNIVGKIRSFATSAANAAGGINPSAWLTFSGSCLPFSKNKGTTRHINIVIAQEIKMIRKSDQLIFASPT